MIDGSGQWAAQGLTRRQANAALFDFGILSSVLHGALMFVQAFVYPNEHAHLWADVPIAFAVALILWVYHPNRVASKTAMA